MTKCTWPTPGPWVVNPARRKPIVGYAVGDGGDPLPIVDVVYGYDGGQARANARLIAQAPEFYAAAKALLAAMSPHMTHRNAAERRAYQALRIAIAKVEQE